MKKAKAKPKTFAQKLKSFFKWSFITLMVLGVLGGIFGVIIFKELIKDMPELDTSLIYGDELSVIYDKDGNVISEFGLEKRSWIEYEEISPVLVDAFIATEDSNFFKHKGVDFTRLAVAIINNIIYKDDQGASTITQQLIKQTHLTSAKTFERKAQEMVLSWELEKTLSKEEILEAYLNFSYFGAGLYGVEKAAQYYFGVSASEVDLAQASTLAGLVQRPEAYRPDKYPELAESRREIVLKLMVRHGYITEAQMQEVLGQPLEEILFCETSGIDDQDKYQSFIDVVLTEVEQKYGLDPRKGLEIYTTMDAEAQKLVYDLQHPELAKEHDVYWPSDMQSGIVFMDTQTGEVRAIGGGYNEENVQRSYNLATQIQRQPGSTAKPIFAYGPAIECLNWGSGTNVNDELYTYQDGSGKIIHNYTQEYQGRMTIRHALNKSLNIAAVKAFNAVGSGRVQAFAEKLGFDFKDGGVYESAAIGGVEVGYSPLQMAGAYAAFGNGGTYNEPITVTKIVTQTGEEIQAEQESVKAMSEETAYIMTDMLHTVMTDGTGKTANVEGMYLSGKTGTTNFPQEILDANNFPSNAIRDSWFVGYSSEYTAAIWTGYDDTSEGHYIDNNSQSMPWKVFNRLMSKRNTAGSQAPSRPSSVIEVEIEKESGEVDGETKLPSAQTPSGYRSRELFIASNAPKEVSTRFSQVETPQNFKGVVKDGIFTFEWEHVGNFSLKADEINQQIKTAVGYASKASYISEVPELTIGEAELRMMLRRIEATGQTVYDVYGTTYRGEDVLLGTTTENTLAMDKATIEEMSMYEMFYVVARYEKLSDSTSEPSGAVKVDCEVCLKPITIPNLKGYPKASVEKWALENGITVKYEEVEDVNFSEGTVVSTSPNEGVLLPNETLIVTVVKNLLKLPDYTGRLNAVNLYKEWAKQNEIELVIYEVYDDQVTKGKIVEMSHRVGAVIKPGELFSITLSLGKDLSSIEEEVEEDVSDSVEEEEELDEGVIE